MQIKHRSVQLTLKDSPIGLDYYGLRDSIVLASAGGVFFYRIADCGTPNQLLCYDQVPDVNGVRIQQNERAHFATIGKNAVTVWDPKHTVAPMAHTLSSTRGVTNCQWCKDDPHLLSLALESGMINVWDLRTMTKPAQQLFFGKRVQKMEWCGASDPKLLAVSAENKYVLIWDTRMLPGSNGGKEVSPNESYMLLEPEQGVSDFSWAEEAAPRSSSSSSLPSSSCPYIWTASELGEQLDLHRIGRTNNDFHSSVEISHSSAPRHNSRIVGHPHGQGLLVLHEEDNCTKFNFVDIRHHQSVESDQSIARTAERVVGVHWRHAQHGSYGAAEYFHRSLVACSAKGLLHVFDWTKRKHSNSWDDKVLLPKPKGHSFQHIDSLMLPGFREPILAQKHRNKLSLKRIVSGACINGLRDENESSPAGAVPNRAVVGPKTFFLLINHDLTVLENAVRHGGFEGVRVGAIDQFARMIVLEVLIPTADNFTINNFNATFNNHFRKEELDAFYAKGAQGRTVDLTILFSSKTSEFWVTPKISLENKSSCAIDSDTLGVISNEISSLIRTRALQRSTTQLRSDRLQWKSSDHASEPILLQVAKLLFKRVISVWQKQSEGFAIGSWKQSQDSVSLSLAETRRENEDIQGLYLQYVEQKAFSVAFPVVSAGLFNGKGELVLFGNAQLSVAQTPSRSCCEVVTNIPCNAYPGTCSDTCPAASSQEPQNNRLTKTHKAFSHVMVSQYIKKATSEAVISKNGDAAGPRSRHKAHQMTASDRGVIEQKDDAWSSQDEDLDDEEEDEDNEEESEETEETEEAEEDFDYLPGYDFEEKQEVALVASDSLRGAKRRVSYSKEAPLSLLRKDTSLSDMSSAEPSKLLDSDLAEHNKCRLVGPVEFTLYSNSVLGESVRLGLEYSLGPIKCNNSDRGLNFLADRVAACRHNAQVVQRITPWNAGLVQYWNLLAVALDVSAIEDSNGLISWRHSALGQSLFVKLVHFLLEAKCLQTWATTVCVIGSGLSMLNLLSIDQQKNIFVQFLPKNLSGSTARFSTVLETMVYSGAHIVQRFGDIARATDMLNRLSSEERSSKKIPFCLPRATTDRMSVSISCMFCQEPVSFRSESKYSVAWSRRDQHAITASNSSSSLSRQRGVSKQKSKSTPSSPSVTLQGQPWCLSCNMFGIYCAVCVQPVRNMASLCMRCGHGGHEEDLAMWFDSNSECPTGCGCLCRSQQDESNPDEEVVFFEDDDSEYLSLSPDRTFGSNSNNNIAAYQSNNASRAMGKQQSVSLFRTFSKHILGQPDYYYNGDVKGHHFNNFFDDLS